MKISEIDKVTQGLQGLLETVVDIPIYVNRNRPTKGLPEQFVDVQINGTIRSLTNTRELSVGRIAAAIHTKLLSTDAVNEKKEDIILKKIEELFNNGTITNGIFKYTIASDMIFNGKSILTGYSSKVLNIEVTIYKNN